MAGGPYQDTNGSRYIIWSAKKLHPEKPKIREELKTKSKKEGAKRKHRLEELYSVGKHDPWVRRWYENETIKPFITGSLLSNDIKDIRSAETITLVKAIEKYIDYQVRRPRGWSERTEEKSGRRLRFLGKLIGQERTLSSINEKEIHTAIFRETAKSEHTINTDRAVFTAFANYAKKQKWIDTVWDIETPVPQQKVPKFMHSDELTSICLCKLFDVDMDIKDGFVQEHIHQARFVLMWQLMAGTGIRPEEGVNIEIDDVHNDQILIGSNYRGKTNAQRMVPILYEARQAVDLLTSKNYRKKDDALRSSKLLLGIESESVKNRSSSELKRFWEMLYPKKGNRTAYNLRDFFAVRFLSDNRDQNQDFRFLQLRNILGHSSVTTTEKYLKAVPNRLDLTPDKSIDWQKRTTEIRNILTKNRDKVTK